VLGEVDASVADTTTALESFAAASENADPLNVAV